MPARSPRCGQKSRAVKPGPHPRLPPKGGSVGRSAAEDGKEWLFGLGVPILPAQKQKKREARSLRPAKLGAPREKPFLAVADPVGPAKPHQTEGTCLHQASQAALRGPKEEDRDRWQPTCEGRFLAAKPPPTHHGDGEALQCTGFSGRRYASNSKSSSPP